MGKEFNCVICELWVDVGLAVRDVSPEIALSEDFLGLVVGLVDVVLLEDLLVITSLLCLVGMDDVLIILVESVIALGHLRGKPMVSADSLTDPLVLFCALLIQDDEDQIKTR
jgi:hypothetical protein